MSAYIGIDPGAHGALCRIDGDAIEVIDLPYVDGYVDARSVFEWLRARPGGVVVIEKQTKQGGGGVKKIDGRFVTVNANVATVATQWCNYGMLRAVLSLEGHRFEEVAAARWKAALGLSRDKRQSVDAARRLWPGETWLVSKDGRAEAALLAEFGRRKNL